MLRPLWIVHKCPAEKNDVDFSWKRACAREFESGYQKHSENFSKKKRWHVESTGSRGQPQDNSWNAHAGTWNAYTGTWNAYSGTWNAYTGTWIRGSQKNLKSFLFFFDGCLF